MPAAAVCEAHPLGAGRRSVSVPAAARGRARRPDGAVPVAAQRLLRAKPGVFPKRRFLRRVPPRHSDGGVQPRRLIEVLAGLTFARGFDYVGWRTGFAWLGRSLLSFENGYLVYHVMRLLMDTRSCFPSFSDHVLFGFGFDFTHVGRGELTSGHNVVALKISSTEVRVNG